MKHRVLYIAVGMLLVLAAAVYFVFFKTDSTSISTNVGNAFASPGSAAAPSITSTSAVQPPHTKQYQSGAYHFSLYYPDDLTVSENPGAGGTMVVLFKDKDQQVGFEIFIAPYTDPQISQARFLLDEPSGVMNSPQNITIDGAAATEFLSTNAAMGSAREIWFLHGGYLYEVTTPQPLDSWLLQTMQTWRFN